MEKIKQKPIEKIKTVIIAILTVTMLALAALYIGGSQFAPASSAINSADMPSGAVAVGEDAPKQLSVSEKNLLAISFIGIRYGSFGGGAYGSEAAARDLFDFAVEPLHALLSSSARVKPTSKEQFDMAVSSGHYICISLVAPLPYQVIYALCGEYTAPLGSEDAINPEVLLLAFDKSGKTTLYMRERDSYFMSVCDYTVKPSELSAMASDSRLYSFEVTGGIPICEGAPFLKTLSLASVDEPLEAELLQLLSLLDYDGIETQPAAYSTGYTVVAPHGTLSVGDCKMVYKASIDGGLSISGLLDAPKSEFDIDMLDVLLATVSLAEDLRTAAPSVSGSTLGLYIDGFYRENDGYTVLFGLSEDNIPIFGDGYPYFAKVTVSGAKVTDIEVNFIFAERSGYVYSPFSSAWEYRYAAKRANIYSMLLRYNVASLPTDEFFAAWYYKGDRRATE